MVAVLAIPDLLQGERIRDGMDLNFALGSAMEPLRQRARSVTRASPTLSAMGDDGLFVHDPQKPGSPRHNAAGIPKDINPLDPCGACSEWLRKIAEINPDFQVVTFTSLDCSHIHVKKFV